jgi:hypothetical protein
MSFIAAFNIAFVVSIFIVQHYLQFPLVKSIQAHSSSNADSLQHGAWLSLPLLHDKKPELFMAPAYVRS